MFERFTKTKKFFSEEDRYAFYAEVANQIEQGQRDIGVWTKAFADAGGDEKQAKSIYIELMVEKKILAAEAELEIQSQLLNESEKKEKKRIKAEQDAIEQAKFDAKLDRRSKQFGFLYWVPLFLYIPIVGYLSWQISDVNFFLVFMVWSCIYLICSYIYHFLFLDIFLGLILGFDLAEVADTKSKIKNKEKKVNTLIDELDYVMNMGAKRPFNKRNYQKIDTLLDTYFRDPALFSTDAKIELRKIVYKAIKDLPKTYADDKVMLKKRERKLRKL